MSIASIGAVFRMLALDITVMLGLLLIAGIVMLGGMELPRTALSDMELDGAIIFAAVILAPLAEEIAFRGWLSGRLGHVLSLIVLVALVPLLVHGLALAGFSFGDDALESGLAAMGLSAIAAALIALVVLFLLRNRPAMAWFQRIFPLFFWLSTVAFSLIHLFNFPADQMAMALPLVLPQLATGAILGYVRVNYGLWSSILLHFLHNSLFISLVLLANNMNG